MELLAVRLALEEWRHWLEGSAQLFLVWTDHKNLEYIRSAKRLNSHQARWALFFFLASHFLTGQDPKMSNLIALSRLFGFPRGETLTETILPKGVGVGSISWDIKLQVEMAGRQCEAPRECPDGLLFVPVELLMWSPTGDLNLFHGFGRSSANRLGPLRVCPQDSIPRPTGSVSEPTRISKEPSAAWPPRILVLGVNS